MINKIVLILLILLHHFTYASGTNQILIRPVATEIKELFEKVNIVGACQNTLSRDYYAGDDGIIEFVSDSQGKIAQEGELIITIDQKIAESNLLKHQVSYDLAKNAFERDKKLFAQKVTSQVALDNSKYKLADAENQLAQAAKNYNSMVITAPFTGKVSTIKVTVGDKVKSGDLLFTIIANKSQEIITELPESFYESVYSVGTVNVSDFSGKKAQAKITSISPVLSKNGTIQVRLLLDDVDVMFNHGGYVNAEFIINKHNALALPEMAVMRNEQGSFVYKITEGNKIVQIYVTLGTRTDNWIEIHSKDIQLGDLVVLEGITKVQEGSIVKLLD